MKIIYLFIVVFLIFLFMPIVYAYCYFKLRKGEILQINQNKIRSARYFGLSFSRKVEEGLKNSTNGIIHLSRDEAYLTEDDNSYGKVNEILLCLKEPFEASGYVQYYKKEIYCAEDCVLDYDNLKFRSVFSKKNMIIGDCIKIIRWVDCEGTLAIYDDCDLGVSATSAKGICIGYRNRFKRLYAPVIHVGQRPDALFDPFADKNEKIFHLCPTTNRKHILRHVHERMENDEGIVDCSVLSWQTIIVNENVIVQGDVRSHAGVRIGKDAIVGGNVFAERDITIETGACVMGNVFSQGKVKIEDGGTVGRVGRICSLIACGNIELGNQVTIYGYVSCEGKGIIRPEKDTKVDPMKKNKVQFLEYTENRMELKFVSLQEYKQVDSQGFRNRSDIVTAEIPEGATVIQDSFLFGNKILTNVKLPATLFKIGAYAFADDEKLEKINGLGDTHVEEIGISAFENCPCICEIHIPDTLKKIKGAAFAGCCELREFVMSDKSQLIYVGDHAFRDCVKLVQICLPPTVTYVGVSAFKNCTGLERIDAPESSRGQIGLSEVEKLVHYYSMTETKGNGG